MPSSSKTFFNPYIVGQLTLLLGGVALGLAALPPAVLEEPPRPLASDETTREPSPALEAKLRAFRATAMACAILGLCVGPIGWLREKPPLLPLVGMSLSVVALFWYYIVMGIVLAVVLIVVLLFVAAHIG